VYLYNGEFGVCSRNLDLKESEGNAFWKAVRAAKVEEKMRKSFIGNWAIQGELLGAGLQENRLHIEGKKILWLNVFDIDIFKYLNFREFLFCMNKQLELETVPIITEEYGLDDNIENLVKMSIGRSLIYPKAWREGIVIRPIEEMIDLQMSSEFNNGRVSFKVVNSEYLIEEA